MRVNGVHARTENRQISTRSKTKNKMAQARITQEQRSVTVIVQHTLLHQHPANEYSIIYRTTTTQLQHQLQSEQNFRILPSVLQLQFWGKLHVASLLFLQSLSEKIAKGCYRGHELFYMLS